jgi:hypothetical protein
VSLPTASAIDPAEFADGHIAEEPTIRARDWISVAGLVVSVVGLSIVIWQFTRAPNAQEENQASDPAN